MSASITLLGGLDSSRPTYPRLAKPSMPIIEVEPRPQVDEAAFASFIAKVQKSKAYVFSRARYKFRDVSPDALDDFWTDTLTELWFVFHKFDGGPYLHFVWSIYRNVVLAQLRADRRRRARELQAAQTWHRERETANLRSLQRERDREQSAEAAEAAVIELWWAMDKLTEDERQALLEASSEQGRATGEVARVLGWPAGKVKGVLQRSRRRLRELLLTVGIVVPGALPAERIDGQRLVPQLVGRCSWIGGAH